jgi:hypothetical protein
MTASTKPLQGQCLCGAVKVTATPKEKVTDACHCTMCRTWSAGPFIALQCGSDVTIEGGDAIGVYKSSDWAERVFCKTCGSCITYRMQQGGDCHMNAQLFDEAPEYPLSMQVFIDEKPSSYSFAQDTKTMTGPELFALFAGDQDPSGGSKDA